MSISTTDHQIQKIFTPEFMQLDRLLKRFNVFDATDMRRREVKHTKFLAHLLNPNESHGLGIKFLENFIINLNNESNGQPIDFLSLDLMNAQIFSEASLENSGKKGMAIDLLLLIPNVIGNKGITLIAIEAKVDAKESVNQLSSYHRQIEKIYERKTLNRHYYFLTAGVDEPSDSTWSGVTFRTVVTPTIETLISSYEETISDYLISIFKDYIEIIDGDHAQETEADRLAEKISQEALTLIKSLNPDADFMTQERIIQIRFRAALEFLKNYDNDPRKNINLSFEKLLKDKSLSFSLFRHESSSRQFLRFSFLSEENRKFLHEICSQSKHSWLSSKRHLAFEFSLKQATDPQKIDIQFKLVLGPTNQSFSQRQELINSITKFVFHLLNPDTDEKWTPPSKNASPVYSTVIGFKALAKYSKRNLDTESTLEFIKKSIGDEYLINLSKAIDNGLKEFRQNEFLDE
jgi:hypothetical protein